MAVDVARLPLVAASVDVVVIAVADLGAAVAVCSNVVGHCASSPDSVAAKGAFSFVTA